MRLCAALGGFCREEAVLIGGGADLALGARKFFCGGRGGRWDSHRRIAWEWRVPVDFAGLPRIVIRGR
jgi:hypothetical protein